MAFDPKLGAAQDEAVRNIVRPESEGGAILAADVGLGKTRMGLLVARALREKVVLVVAPLSTLEDWEAAAGELYPELTVRTINSLKEGKSALIDFQWKLQGLYLITHEYWERLAWEKVLIRKRRKTDPDKYRKVDSGLWSMPGYMMIFDESHRSANTTNWTFKALMNLHPSVFRLGMSGTWTGDKFEGAYGATRWVWPHRTDIIPERLKDWRHMWATWKYSPFTPDKEETTGEKDPGAFVASLPCYVKMESELPPPEQHTLWVDLTPEQRRVYDELDDRMVAWILDDPLVVELPVTKRTRQRQATLAMPKLAFDPETGELLEVAFALDAESAKIDRLFQAINGDDPELGDLLVGEKLLILTDSQKFARVLTYRLNQEFGDVAREWSGKITKKNRKLAKSEFIDGDVRYLVGVQSAMGTGTNGLQKAAHIVVFMSRADRRIDNEQGIGRLWRMGQEKIVHVLHILAKATLDTGQLSKQQEDAIKLKRSMRAKTKRQEGDHEV